MSNYSNAKLTRVFNKYTKVIDQDRQLKFNRLITAMSTLISPSNYPNHEVDNAAFTITVYCKDKPHKKGLAKRATKVLNSYLKNFNKEIRYILENYNFNNE